VAWPDDVRPKLKVMTRTLATLLVAALIAGCGGGSDPLPEKAAETGARVVAREPGAPRMIDLTARSPALGRDAKVRLMTPDGWTPEKLAEHWLPAVQPAFTPLERTRDVYGWDPV